MTPILYTGQRAKPHPSFWMSNNALHACLYAVINNGYVFLSQPLDLKDWDSIKEKLGIEERLWYLDKSYGIESDVFRTVSRMKPGIYDSEVGEALINAEIPLNTISKQELLRHIIKTHTMSGGETDITPDTLETMFRRDHTKKLLGTAFDSFQELFRPYHE